jgi:hypothetical protein
MAELKGFYYKFIFEVWVRPGRRKTTPEGSLDACLSYTTSTHRDGFYFFVLVFLSFTRQLVPLENAPLLVLRRF